MQYVLRDFCYVVVIKTKHLICYNGCTFRFFYNDERGADSKVTKSYKWHLLFMGTQRIPTKIGRHSSISSDSSLHVVTWKEKEWNSKVPFNWKAQDYWPKSHIYLISLNFFFCGVWLFFFSKRAFILIKIKWLFGFKPQAFLFEWD